MLCVNLEFSLMSVINSFLGLLGGFMTWRIFVVLACPAPLFCWGTCSPVPVMSASILPPAGLRRSCWGGVCGPAKSVTSLFRLLHWCGATFRFPCIAQVEVCWWPYSHLVGEPAAEEASTMAGRGDLVGQSAWAASSESSTPFSLMLFYMPLTQARIVPLLFKRVMCLIAMKCGAELLPSTSPSLHGMYALSASTDIKMQFYSSTQSLYW